MMGQAPIAHHADNPKNLQGGIDVLLRHLDAWQELQFPQTKMYSSRISLEGFPQQMLAECFQGTGQNGPARLRLMGTWKFPIDDEEDGYM
ncbi:MAG: hypothetical protein M0Z53_10830, partial [Thermaerobacter sp.]|nr:hypothetical protein [Thermaerobacter sp.]